MIARVWAWLWSRPAVAWGLAVALVLMVAAILARDRGLGRRAAAALDGAYSRDRERALVELDLARRADGVRAAEVRALEARLASLRGRLSTGYALSGLTSDEIAARLARLRL